ncbi:hypothetical protein D3C77_767210 [compost metagenome]
MGETCRRLLALACEQIGEHRIGLGALALHAQGTGQVSCQPGIIGRELACLAQLTLGSGPVFTLQRLPGLPAQQLKL